MAPEPQQLQPGKSVVMGVYGLPGAGKTRFVASTDNPVLIVRPPTDHTDSIGKRSNVQEVVIHDWNEQLEHYQWGQQGGYGDYAWVWIDGLTLFEEIGMDDVFQAAIDRNPHRAEHGPDKGEYGVNRQRLSKWIRDMVGLSKAGMFNFGWTAHVMDYTDPVEDRELWTPQVGGYDGKMSMKLCGYTNILAYLSASEPKDDERQELLVVDGDGFNGKDQYHCFPELKSGRHGFVDPTLADVEAAIAKARKPARRRSKPKAARKRRTRTRA